MATFYKFVNGQIVLATFVYVPENQKYNAVYHFDSNPGGAIFVNGLPPLDTNNAEVKDIKINETEVEGLYRMYDIWYRVQGKDITPIAYAIRDRVTALAKKYLPPLGYFVADRDTSEEEYDTKSDEDMPALENIPAP